MGCGEEIWGVFASQCLFFDAKAIDFSREKIAIQETLAARLKTSRFTPVFADATKMPFSSEYFDVVNCFAVLPLIPGQGDCAVMREIGRVLKYSGRALITVGYGNEYKEQIDTASTKGFSRVYDETALWERLIVPSGLRLEKRIYFVEPKLKFSKLWFRMPFLLKLPLRWLS